MTPEQRAEALRLLQALQAMYGARALPVVIPVPQAIAEPKA